MASAVSPAFCLTSLPVVWAETVTGRASVIERAMARSLGMTTSSAHETSRIAVLSPDRLERERGAMTRSMPAVAVALALTIPAVCLADPKEEANKKLVVEFYDKALNQKDFEAASRYFGNRYVQHNPNAPDGIEGF